jgi:eukaryotic-like serine/threonine-protein kinase
MEVPRRIGRYELLNQIGHSSTSELYRGQDTVLGREVAVKIMAAGFLGDAAAHTRFFREAKAAARLSHPNIVTIFEFGEQDDTPFIVMELLRGRSLAERLRQQPRMPLRDSLDAAIQLCAGLEAAHAQGVVHRDVNPRNIWVCQDGTVKLLDFGIATAGSGTLSGVDAVETPRYLSPEQITGADVDARTDIFSAGLVLYEMLRGRHAFEAASPTGVMMRIVNEEADPLESDDLPAPLAVAVARSLQKSPAARYPRAADFARDLKSVKTHLSAQTDAALMPVDQTTAVEIPAAIRESPRENRPPFLSALPINDRALLVIVLSLAVLAGGLAAYCG